MTTQFGKQNFTDDIKQWAIDRNLHTASPDKQMLKLVEEFGELGEAMAKGNMDLFRDALGDMYVVMTILAMQKGTDIEDCINLAYNEIKDRKGKMVDGVFVKSSDLRNSTGKIDVGDVDITDITSKEYSEWFDRGKH